MSSLPPIQLTGPARDAHKGTMGTVLIVAGSIRYAGAAALATEGAARAGAGLVIAAVPASIAARVAEEKPSRIVVPLREDHRGQCAWAAMPEIRGLAEDADAIVFGPGVGHGEFLRAVLGAMLEIDRTLILDADGLNLLAATDRVSLKRTAPLVLTPHPGEASRLLGTSTQKIQDDRETAVRRLAEEFGALAVLKGAGTLVDDGSVCFRNETGNPGLATGGAGDVLAGTIGAFCARGLSAFDAARLGVWLHGRAADIAARAMGEDSLLPEDVLDRYPDAMSECHE